MNNNETFKNKATYYLQVELQKWKEHLQVRIVLKYVFALVLARMYNSFTFYSFTPDYIT